MKQKRIMQHMTRKVLFACIDIRCGKAQQLWQGEFTRLPVELKESISCCKSFQAKPKIKILFSIALQISAHH